MSHKKKIFEDLQQTLKALDDKRKKEEDPEKRALLLKEYEDLEANIYRKKRILVKKNRLHKLFDRLFRMFFYLRLRK